MPTAVEIMKKDEEDRRLMILADAQERFVARWEPRDGRESDEFRRELNYLIHLTYREAQEPLTKQLTDFAMRMPMPFVVKP